MTFRRVNLNRFKSWLINGVLSSALFPVRVRRKLMRAVGIRIGKATVEHGGAITGDWTKLQIGNGVFINAGYSLHPTGGIDIGDRVFLGPRVVIMTGTHEIGPSEQRASSPTRFRRVSIGSGSWIGAGAIVCPGVNIGSGCIVAPGAVVTVDLEEDCFYAGVPAKLKRRL